MAAIKDVAKLAGVSVAAVSKYLKTPDNMREETRQKIAQAIQELNYRPNPFAQSLRTGKTNMIAITIPEVDNPYFNKMFKLLQAYCEDRGLLAILLKNSNPEQAKNAASILKSGLVDGVICYDEGQADTFIMELEVSVPVVKVGPVTESEYAATVGIDLRTGIEKLCAHLEQTGVRRLGYIGPDSDVSSRQKIGAIKSYCAHSDLYLDPKVFMTDCHTYSGGFDCCQKLLDSGIDLPDAIIVESDMIALGVIKALQEKNYRVPEDVSIVGFDDLPFSEIAYPPLTTIRVPNKEMGRLAVKKLIDLIENPGGPITKTEVGTTFVKRQTVKRIKS